MGVAANEARALHARLHMALVLDRMVLMWYIRSIGIYLCEYTLVPVT